MISTTLAGVSHHVCVVTGASSGIGKETARALAAQGATVVLACRDEARAKAARDEIIASTAQRDVTTMPLDLASVPSVDAFVEAFARRFQRLDVLVNNAAVLFRRRTLTQSGLEASFAVNHLGPMALSLGLLELLLASAPSRVVMVSSKLHAGAPLDLEDLSWEKRKYSAFGAYNATKLANVVFARTLARRLGDTKVRVNSLHPGEAGTAIARDFGKAMTLLMRVLYGSPKRAAERTLFVATSHDAGAVSGAYFQDGKVARASPVADDVGVQDRLWSVSEALLRSCRESR
jgi:NAD(P)-dependent dehydrogenase (short-subunit alcohol dehydrogenase family)